MRALPDIARDIETDECHPARDTGWQKRSSPLLLTVDEAAALLRTTKRAVYAMIERRQLPGITRIGRRVLLRADDLLHWLDQKRAPSLKE